MAFEEERKAGPPAWLVSFGDMMTLILTFFILLVSMASSRDMSLVAGGTGAFVVRLRSHGLPGLLTGAEELEILNEVRARFNLPPLAEGESEAPRYDEASSLEVLRAKAATALKPHDEIPQPMVAQFAPDSAELGRDSRRYLDLVADSLRPGIHHRLLLEGHANDAGAQYGGDNGWLAFARAAAVREYLVEEHDFQEPFIEARAWLISDTSARGGFAGVDARLVMPQVE